MKVGIFPGFDLQSYRFFPNTFYPGMAACLAAWNGMISWYPLQVVTQQWYRDFCAEDNLERDLLYEVLRAGNYLDIRPLLDLACLKLAFQLQGKNVDEVRQAKPHKNERFWCAPVSDTHSAHVSRIDSLMCFFLVVC